MGSFSVELDPVQMREATSQAIMGILTPEVKTELIRKAIGELLAPTDNSYYGSRKVSPLEKAFYDAVQVVAKEVCKEVVAADLTIRERLRVLAQETATKVMNLNSDDMANKMAESFVHSMRRKDD